MEESVFCEFCGYNPEESDEERWYTACVGCDSLFCEKCGDVNRMLCNECIEEGIEPFEY